MIFIGRSEIELRNGPGTCLRRYHEAKYHVDNKPIASAVMIPEEDVGVRFPIDHAAS